MKKENENESHPIATNRIDVLWEKEAFFKKYSIVSYHGYNNKGKNLAYEKLSDMPCISVAGFWARFDNFRSAMRFFVLVEREKGQEVLEDLRKGKDWITAGFDTLDNYDERLQKRIIASLAINSLGKKGSNKMYSDGSLYICDNRNFLVPKKRMELVCLKIEINEYLILTAKTTSFSHPYNNDNLLQHTDTVFLKSNTLKGNWWEGKTITPVVINKDNVNKFALGDLYINKKLFNDNRNLVPYWPYDINNYPHGKLFAISQVMKLTNEEFKGLIHLEFKEFKDSTYDDKTLSKNEMLEFMKKYFSKRTITIEDEINNEGTQKLKDTFIKETQELMEGNLLFSQETTDMVLRICEPKKEARGNSLYSDSAKRKDRGFIIQHLTFSGNPSEDEITKAAVRRILIEMLVKDCINKGILPKKLRPLLQGWVFYRYKLNKGMVHGCSLKVGEDGHMNFTNYGLSKEFGGADFETFVKAELMYLDTAKIKGPRDYMAMKKDGNVYIFIDTDEIPMLDVKLIDDLYEQIANGEQEETKRGLEDIKISRIKRKAEYRKYLQAFEGFHIWESEGIDGKDNEGYTYISGTKKDNLKITQKTKMDRMPRARRIFILHKENPEIISSDIEEIKGMLKFGFARWNEFMTYPYPFKFMQESLDHNCEIEYNKHWSEINSKSEL